MQLEHILMAHGLIGRGGKSTPLPSISNFVGQSNNIGTEIILNWTNPSVLEFQKVQIFMSNTDISNVSYENLLLSGNMIVDEKKTTHTVTGLSHNNIRYFKAFGIFTVLGEVEVSNGVSLQVTTKDIVPPNTITNFTGTGDDTTVVLTWINPVDSDFEKVKIMYKQGAYPTSHTDGTLGHEGGGTSKAVTGLTNDVEYYFRAFTFDNAGNVNSGTTNQQIVVVPKAYQLYGVKIDTNNSNPETALTYTDMAVGFTPAFCNNGNWQMGSWENKFPYDQIKPCLFKNGLVNYYLNPNDYTKKLDGSVADITSGNDGDVLIEFPKIYWKFETIGTDLYIRYSDVQVDSGYKCLAHTVGTTIKDKIYISAYRGFSTGGKLRSLSGKLPTATQTIGRFRTLAQANGAGYQQMAYYPLLMLQILALVAGKNRDSQTQLGRGYVDGNTSATNTGQTNTNGMYYGETTGKKQNKFCGIEDFYGNQMLFIDGMYSDASWNMMISNQSVFNDTGSGYANQGKGATANLNGYIGDIQGGTETGFIIKASNGSATTHYSDYSTLNGGCLPAFGGYWNYADVAGAFCLQVALSGFTSNAYYGAALCFIGS